MVLLLVVLLIIAALSGLSIYVARSIFRPKKWETDASREYEIENKRYSSDYMTGFDIKDVRIESEGLRLYGQLINQNAARTVIIMHGHTYTLYGSYKYARMFLERGYNVLMPDQRYHGRSEGRNCTLGYKESGDLHRWIEFIDREIPGNEVLGLHGESMGAATVLLGGDCEAVDFVIEDCSFSDMKTQITDLMWKRFRIPGFVIYPVDFFSRLLYDAPLLKINPIDNIGNIKVPLLLIHGDDDKYVGLDHFERLSEKKKDTDSTYVCRGAAHAQSFATDKQLYEQKVDAFLKKVDG